jgi:hypothetical protein
MRVLGCTETAVVWGVVTECVGSMTVISTFTVGGVRGGEGGFMCGGGDRGCLKESGGFLRCSSLSILISCCR